MNYMNRRKNLNKKNSLKVVKHKMLKINSRKIKKFQKKKTQKAQKKYSKFIKAKDKNFNLPTFPRNRRVRASVFA